MANHTTTTKIRHSERDGNLDRQVSFLRASCREVAGNQIFRHGKIFESAGRDVPSDPVHAQESSLQFQHFEQQHLEAKGQDIEVQSLRVACPRQCATEWKARLQ